jgi:hypothetical protein
MHAVALQDKGHGHPLPKFGEWDVKNPATSEGFTVIFQKARDGKKTTGPGNVRAGIPPAFRNGGGDGGYRPDFKYGDSSQYTPPKRIKVRVCLCTLTYVHNARGYVYSPLILRVLTRGPLVDRRRSGPSVAADSKLAAAAADSKGERSCST